MKKTVYILMSVATALVLFCCLSGFSPVKTEVLTVLDTEVGCVVKAGEVDKVVLFGHYANKGLYADRLKIEIRDYKSNALKLVIVPNLNGGYKPTLLLEKFKDNGLKQIFLGADSGGSGGFQYSFIYSVAGSALTVMWDFNNFKKEYDATFLDNYLLSVSERGGRARYTAYIGGRPKDYLDALYAVDGKLLKPQTGDVSALNVAFPFFNPTADLFGLMIAQRVTGLYNADSFGYVQHLSVYKNGEFASYLTTLNVF